MGGINNCAVFVVAMSKVLVTDEPLPSATMLPGVNVQEMPGGSVPQERATVPANLLICASVIVRCPVVPRPSDRDERFDVIVKSGAFGSTAEPLRDTTVVPFAMFVESFATFAGPVKLPVTRGAKIRLISQPLPEPSIVVPEQSVAPLVPWLKY